MPINYSLLFGDATSQTFPATAAGTYNLSTPLAAGLYEITTDTSQSSFTLGIQTATGYRFTGTIRGGKGYIAVPTTSTKIVIPASMTYPVNINIRLGSYTMTAAPTGTSLTLTAGNIGTIAWTNPSGSTDTIAYYRDGTNVSLATTTSPKTSVAISGASHGSPANVLVVGKDANGITSIGSEATSSTNVVVPISGGTATFTTSGPTTYLVNTFTGSGTLSVNATSNIEYLIVAGGGSGSYGGGGAGGMRTATTSSTPVGTYTVTVGAGGPAKTAGNQNGDGNIAQQGNSGSNSSIAFSSAITSTGGGGGGCLIGANPSSVTPGSSGVNGGSGGGQGSSYNGSLTSTNYGTGTSGQGNNGGSGAMWNGSFGYRGGGGGGAGAVGGNAGNAAGNGGNGSASSISGTSVTYAGGGAGASNAANGVGGTGGGGSANTNGTANTGGGGGGTSQGANPSSGGSGIIIVRVAL